MNKIIFFISCGILSICLLGCTNSEPEENIASDSNISSDATIDNSPNQESISKSEEKQDDSVAKNSENSEINAQETSKSSDENTTLKQDSNNKGEAIKVSNLQKLIDQDMALYAENPLTKEHIVSIKLKNLSADFKGKEYFIHVDGENYKFEVNEVDSNFLTVVINPDKINEKGIKEAEVKVY